MPFSPLRPRIRNEGTDHVRPDLTPIVQLPDRGVVVGSAAAGATNLPAADDKPKAGSPAAPRARRGRVQRDYSPPSFKPSWKKPQINRVLVQDFVIYAHSELDMVKKLLEKEPALINATMDWGGGDWESGLGGASHMGRATSSSSCWSRAPASTSSAPP